LIGIYIVKSFWGSIATTCWNKIQEGFLWIVDYQFPYVSIAREYEDEEEAHLLEEQENYALELENSIIEETSEEETTKEQTQEETKEYSVDNLTCYTWEQLNDYEYVKKNLYYVNSSTTITKKQLDVDKMLHTDLTIDKSQDGPQILIYHTHATEYFKDSDKNNPDTLITGVGDYLTQLLEENYGYQVIHDKTVFAYNKAYSLGREKAESILKKYPSIQVVIDMHRDSSGGEHYVSEVDGKKMASVMFFNGMSQDAKGNTIDSRENANLSTNLAFSLQMKVAADELYPGFTRKNYLKAYRYNMHLMGRYALIEVGAENNTVKEAKNAMMPLARVISEVIK
jgi:stage II sporulation protein P